MKNFHWAGLVAAIAIVTGGAASASTLVAFDDFTHFQTYTTGDFVHGGDSTIWSLGTSAAFGGFGIQRNFLVPLGVPVGNLMSSSGVLHYSGSGDEGFQMTYGPSSERPSPLTDLTAYDGFYIDIQSVGSGAFDLSLRFYDHGGATFSGAIDFENVDDRGVFTVDRSSVVGAVDWENIVRVEFLLNPPGVFLQFRMNEWGGIQSAVIPVPPAAGLILLGMAGIGLHRRYTRR